MSIIKMIITKHILGLDGTCMKVIENVSNQHSLLDTERLYKSLKMAQACPRSPYKLSGAPWERERVCRGR